MKKPMAFMSYAHRDNRDGYLTQLHERLSEAVGMQIGEDFEIFRDEDSILWGQRWRERIEESLDKVTFLIPIVTPSFFGSEHCRDELRQFLDREEELGRNDLILPIYYVDSGLLNNEGRRNADELAREVHAHQYADWRELRHEPFTDRTVRRKLAQLAGRIGEVLEEVRELSDTDIRKPAPEVQRTRTEGVVAEQQRAEPATGTGETSKEPAPRTEPPTLTVDQLYRGDHTTISEAIEAATPGTKILVNPGLYEEGLVLDKPLEIIGQGDPEDIMVQASGKNVLLFKTTMGRVSNLSMRQAGGDGDWFGVNIAQGRLELEGCDISSQSLSCVAILGGAHPHLKHNRIHDGKSGGVFVYENGRGTLEDNDIFNDIFSNALTGVAISEGSDPTLRNNRINKNGYQAVWVHDKGGGTIEDNDLTDNAKGAWDVSGDSEPNLKRARNKE